MDTNQRLIEELQATAELTGKQISSVAAVMLLNDLRGFSPQQISNALAKCRAELRTFPTLADILSRLDDGRPGPEEAWAMIPKDEEGSVVWTPEMAEAFGAARPLLLEDDPIAARMTFKEVYTRLVCNSRSNHAPVRWVPSLGFERSGRHLAIKVAVEAGRITHEAAMLYLPEGDPPLRTPRGSPGLKRLGED